MGNFLDDPLPRRHFQFYNFITTNAIKMKLTSIIYLHNTFHLAESCGCNSEGVGGRNRKTSKNKPENQFFGLIFRHFYDLMNTCNINGFLPYSESLVKILYKLDLIWGSYGPKTIQNQPCFFCSSENL